jgi:hypothetical protein
MAVGFACSFRQTSWLSATREMAASMAAGEFQSEDDPKIGSERNFGLVFAIVFLFIASLPILRGGSLRGWALAVAVGFAVMALLAPAVLRPLNHAWFKLGLALHHVINPVIMGAIFFAAVTPMGLLLRARGKDLLRLRWDRESPTYWIERKRPAPARGSMSKQF